MTSLTAVHGHPPSQRNHSRKRERKKLISSLFKIKSEIFPISTTTTNKKNLSWLQTDWESTFEQEWEQSTMACSERVKFALIPFLIAYADSIAPVVEKVQQDPHCPWSLTGVTLFVVLQSKESGNWISFGERVAASIPVAKQASTACCAGI